MWAFVSNDIIAPRVSMILFSLLSRYLKQYLALGRDRQLLITQGYRCVVCVIFFCGCVLLDFQPIHIQWSFYYNFKNCSVNEYIVSQTEYCLTPLTEGRRSSSGIGKATQSPESDFKCLSLPRSSWEWYPEILGTPYLGSITQCLFSAHNVYFVVEAGSKLESIPLHL